MSISSLPPSLAPRSVEDHVRKLEASVEKERGGILNAPGRLITDLFSKSGKKAEAALADAKRTLADGMADGNLDASESKNVLANVARGELALSGFERAKEVGGNVAGGLALGFAPLGRGVGLVKSLATAAGLNVGAHAVLEGKGYSAIDALKDAAVAAGTAGVARGVLNTSLVQRLNPASSYARWIGTGAVAGGVDNAAFAALQQGFRDGNWDQGIGEGALKTAKAAAIGGAIGVALGGAGGGVGGAMAKRSAARAGGDEGNRNVKLGSR